MTNYTTSDLSRKSGDIIADAMRGPVMITQRNKPRLVILSVEEFNRLRARESYPRKVHTLEHMPDELFQEAKNALSKLELEGEDR